MLTPAIFGDYLMDDWFDDLDREFFGKKNPLYGRHAKNLMKTDVREHENSYELDIDLPGFKKEDVQLTLENGYLSIMAGKNLDKEEKEKKSGRLIRQERYSGSLARSFYVGEDLTEEDIKARMEHGVLKLVIPKKEHKEEIPEKKTIMIE